ncbi:hypothetical protein B0H13DRAFT_1891845 [Mycena leptocephala]|nr:hypothetical protein B0H13DRAFT_1891845 [Mycena leptocephala]
MVMDEADWARERDEEKVGRGLGNLSKIDSLAGIVDTDAPGLVPLRSAKSGKKIKRSEIRLRDLPSELQGYFGKLFTPELIRYVARLRPWQIVEPEEVAEIWDPLFPENELALDVDLQTKVLKLADDRITSYHHMFSTTELKALDEVYANQGAKTPEARANAVECLLEGDDKCRAFYYWDYADKEGNVILKGLFSRSPHHSRARCPLRSPNTPIEYPDTTEFPETPLVYTIQAVHMLSCPFSSSWDAEVCQAKRALNYNETGEYLVPPNRLGDFPKANWDDKMEYREGKSVMVNTTSGLVAIVRKLEEKPDLCRKIVKAAIEAALPKKRQRSHKIEVIDVDAIAAADFELVDNDSDWVHFLINAVHFTCATAEY